MNPQHVIYNFGCLPDTLNIFPVVHFVLSTLDPPPQLTAPPTNFFDLMISNAHPILILAQLWFSFA